MFLDHATLAKVMSVPEPAIIAQMMICKITAPE